MKNISLYLLLFTLSSSLIFLGFASEGLSVEDKKQNDKLFQEFLESFPDLDLPHAITAETLKQKKTRTYSKKRGSNRIPQKFGVFVPGVSKSSFGRMPGPSFHVEGKFEQNADFVAIIYRTSPGFSRHNYHSTNYILATYNVKDKNLEPHQRMISSINIGGMNSHLHESQIDKDFNISMQFYKRDFKNADGTPAKDVAYTKTYSISKTGIAKKTSDTSKPKAKKKKPAKKATRAN